MHELNQLAELDQVYEVLDKLCKEFQRCKDPKRTFELHGQIHDLLDHIKSIKEKGLC